MRTSASIAIFLAFISTTVNAVPFSKYGRSCKDIGCRSNEVCEMAHDPCDGSRDACGSYPTCKRSDSGGLSCQSKFCPAGEYCEAKSGVPTCVKTNSNLAPATRRPPGYQRPYTTPKPFTPRPIIPTPPPRGSSFGDRSHGQSGGRNTIGTGSIWDRLFGGGGSKPKTNPAGGSGYRSNFDRTTSRPAASNYYPGGSNNYNTHVKTDSKGDRTWTFSG